MYFYVEKIQSKLERVGWHILHDPIDIESLGVNIEDCEIIARNDRYVILYMEAKSNWRELARKIAESQKTHCLVITKYGKYFIMTTVKDKFENPKTRHLVIDPNSEKYGLCQFIRRIKTNVEDDVILIDERIQQVFNDYTKYVEAIKKFGENLCDVVQQTKDKIIEKQKQNKKYQEESLKFAIICKEILNDTIDQTSVTNMLIQHVVTARIFAMIYDSDFIKTNSIARELERLRTVLGISDKMIDYSDIELVAESITENEERQEFIRIIYEIFYKKLDPNRADRDGIVYTPIEIVDFILKNVQYVLKSEFNTDFSDRSVKILDPFSGTGTFLARLLSSGMLGDSITEKYKEDLFANELLLLAYYIATVNIESTYKDVTNSEYVEFEGMNYTDTLMMDPRYLEGGYHKQEETKLDKFVEIKKRRQKQRKTNLHVIVGNPPYSAGQTSFNDQNQNVDYPDIDKRIENTYLKKLKDVNSKINVNSLYDSYIRSIRWASDRIGESGIIGFVTNGSFIKSEAAAGLRACFQEEFTDVWVFDLRGNQRTQGEISRKEGGKVFGSGSRAPVAITILVKKKVEKKLPGIIRYYDIGDYHSREKKLELIKTFGSINGIQDWNIIQPDKHHDWLNQRTSEFQNYLPMGSKDAKAGKGNALFGIRSGGVNAHRSAWVYNSSKNELMKNMKRHIEYCNKQDLENPTIDPKKCKWNEDLFNALKRSGTQKFSENKIRIALYRPFFTQNMYFDKIFNGGQYKIPLFFPDSNVKNYTLIIPYRGDGIKFSTLFTEYTPDLHVIEQNQCFSLYIYEGDSMKDNITDYALNEYRNNYKDNTITKQSIFYYIYGLLHHPEYRKKYAHNLSRELPHIPMAPDFHSFSKIGKNLADLHLSWDKESCPRYDLGKPLADFGEYQKMAYDRKTDDDTGRKVNDTTKLKINGIPVFDNIPDTQYKVNGRTPLEWAIDRYKVKIDKESGIVNDSTKDLSGKPLDIIPIIERLVYVGVESDKLISKLPKEFEPKNYKPKKSGIDKFMDDSTEEC